MKRITNAIMLCLMFLACNEDDEQTITPTPEYTPASEVEIDITASTDALGYTVLEGCFIGSWNKSTIVSADGNVLIVGGGRNGFSGEKMILVKTTPSGEILYDKEIFESYYGRALGLCEDSGQNIYAVGYVYNDEDLQNRVLAVAKLDLNGNILWENLYGPVDEDITGYNVSVLTNNELVVSGNRAGDLVLLKINTSGEEILFDIKEHPSYGSPNGMIVLADGRTLITSSSGYEMQLSWYDENFELLSKKSYGPASTYGRSTIQLRDNNLLSVGKLTYTAEGSNTIDSQLVLLIKLDPDGEVIWNKTVGGTAKYEDGQSVKENEDGSFVLNGYTQNDHMLIYVDAEGDEINAKYYTDDNTFRGENIVKIANGRNVLTGGYRGGTFFLNVDNYGL